MKKIIFSITFLFLTIFLNAQEYGLVINYKLLEQLTKNQTVRLASNQKFIDSYEKQNKLYDEVNKKVLQIVAIEEFIFKSLTNVSMTIKQGKKLKYLYLYLGAVGKNAKEMFELTSKNPKYAILYTKFYNQILQDVLLIKKQITDELLKEGQDYLMDPYDREVILNSIFERVQILNGNILFINLTLKNAKSIPYLYQVPKLNEYISVDRLLVQDIIFKYNILKN